VAIYLRGTACHAPFNTDKKLFMKVETRAAVLFAKRTKACKFQKCFHSLRIPPQISGEGRTSEGKVGMRRKWGDVKGGEGQKVRDRICHL